MNQNEIRYEVRGVGRVGTYAAAKNAHRCRARKYWALFFWSKECTEDCSQHIGDQYVGGHMHYPKGYVEVEGQPHFKTKTEAIKYFYPLYTLNFGTLERQSLVARGIIQ